MLESDIEVKKGENIKTKEKIQFNEKELKNINKDQIFQVM